jgi:hypothetical protein
MDKVEGNKDGVFENCIIDELLCLFTCFACVPRVIKILFVTHSCII